MTKRFKNIVFDCDSTLTFIEGVDEIAKRKGMGAEITRITHQGMNGEISFGESLYRRLSILKPNKQDINYLYRLYVGHLVPDAVRLIRALKFLGKNVFIVTGGFQQAVEKLAEHLGVDRKSVFGVHLKFGKNEDFLGVKRNHLTEDGGKAAILRKIRKTGPILFVGDGATDLEAKNEVDLFVGFGGVVERPTVRDKCELYFTQKTLAPVLALACRPEESVRLSRSIYRKLYYKGKRILKNLERKRIAIKKN